MDTEAFSLDLEARGSLSVECLVNGPIQTNTYFVVSGDEVVIVDPAWKGEDLARHFAVRHPDARIKSLVCTHGHADHTGGLAGLRRALGDDVPFLLCGKDAYTARTHPASLHAMWGIDTEQPPEPDRLLAEGDTIEFGDVCLQVIETPGHTPGGIVLFAATDGGNIAFCGDTLFPGSHGRTDLEGGDETTIMHSLAHLFRLLPEDTLCLCGHNGSTTAADELEENIFVRRALHMGY